MNYGYPKTHIEFWISIIRFMYILLFTFGYPKILSIYSSGLWISKNDLCISKMIYGYPKMIYEYP